MSEIIRTPFTENLRSFYFNALENNNSFDLFRLTARSGQEFIYSPYNDERLTVVFTARSEEELKRIHQTLSKNVRLNTLTVCFVDRPPGTSRWPNTNTRPIMSAKSVDAYRVDKNTTEDIKKEIKEEGPMAVYRFPADIFANALTRRNAFNELGLDRALIENVSGMGIRGHPYDSRLIKQAQDLVYAIREDGSYHC